jgi:hypothetical protein
MLSWHKLLCYVDWKGCDSMISRPIWINMWIRTDDVGWYHDITWGDMWIGQMIYDAVMTKSKVLCGLEKMWQKLSRTIWSKMRIRTDDKGWCHDLIWHGTLIGTDVKRCCLDQFTVLSGFNSMWQKVSWPIWSINWIRTDDTGWCLDLIWCVCEWE